MPQAAKMVAVKGGENMTTEQIRATSTLFQCMRTLTGMSREEARLFLGGLPEGEMRTLEKPKTFFVKLQHITALSEILERVEDLIETKLAKPAPPFLLTYAIDPDLVQFDPELHEWMRFASVHRMFTARLWNEWRRLGHPITILSIVPPDYFEFLKTSGLRDSEAARMQWAAGYAQHYKLHSTSDTIRSAPDQAAMAMAELFTFRKRGE